MTAPIRHYLDVLDLIPGPAWSGLVEVKPLREILLPGAYDQMAPASVVVALERAQTLGADYVYFRRTATGEPEAVAWVYDHTERPLGDPERNALHRRVWCAGDVPLVMVFLPTRLDVFHVLKGPKPDGRASPWDEIALVAEVSEALRRFAAARLDDGSALEDARALGFEGSVFEDLAQEVLRCRDKLAPRLGRPLCQKLLILAILVKYLEERRDAKGDGVFPPELFSRHSEGRASNFVGLLREGGPAVLRFFDELAAPQRLNGDVFVMDAALRKALAAADLGPLADALDGRSQGRQLSLWRRYAFDVLPVELISHLYEQFLRAKPEDDDAGIAKQSTGVAYTPPFLVRFVLDEVLPLAVDTPANFRIVDPACGSGVFLVGAYRRLVQRWRRAHGYQHPSVNQLQTLLRDHIFGVEIDEEALRLTVFSLSVALCDCVEPRDIWDHLHFDRLVGTNLHAADYFAVSDRLKNFDLVIGNPPFSSTLTKAAVTAGKRMKERLPGAQLPDKQVALLFLAEALAQTAPTGWVALLQPAGALLYNEGSVGFRDPLLSRYEVVQVIDLTFLSRHLFRRKGRRNPGDTPVAVVFARPTEPSGEPILHATIRRSVVSDQKVALTIEDDDLHWVSPEQARTMPHLWRAHLVGGARVVRLVERLKCDSLRGFLESRRVRGWEFGEGFIEGKPGSKLKRRPADWLTGHDELPTEAVKLDGPDLARVVRIEAIEFAKPRTSELFSAPILLIKKTMEGRKGLPTSILDRPLRFRDSLFGIHAPEAERTDLEAIQGTLRSDLALFWILTTSPELLVDRATSLRQNDIRGVPHPPPELSELERILVGEITRYAADWKVNGPKSAIERPVKAADLEAYQTWFLRILGAVHPSFRPMSFRVEGGAAQVGFAFGPAPASTDGAGRLEALVAEHRRGATRHHRILRFFAGDCLVLVKPARLRFWTVMAAVRDADEAFAELSARGF
jgi:hypothetical protein